MKHAQNLQEYVTASRLIRAVEYSTQSGSQQVKLVLTQVRQNGEQAWQGTGGVDIASNPPEHDKSSSPTGVPRNSGAP